MVEEMNGCSSDEGECCGDQFRGRQQFDDVGSFAVDFYTEWCDVMPLLVDVPSELTSCGSDETDGGDAKADGGEDVTADSSTTLANDSDGGTASKRPSQSPGDEVHCPPCIGKRNFVADAESCGGCHENDAAEQTAAAAVSTDSIAAAARIVDRTYFSSMSPALPGDGSPRLEGVNSMHDHNYMSVTSARVPNANNNCSSCGLTLVERSWRGSRATQQQQQQQPAFNASCRSNNFGVSDPREIQEKPKNVADTMGTNNELLHDATVQASDTANSSSGGNKAGNGGSDGRSYNYNLSVDVEPGGSPATTIHSTAAESAAVAGNLNNTHDEERLTVDAVNNGQEQIFVNDVIDFMWEMEDWPTSWYPFDVDAAPTDPARPAVSVVDVTAASFLDARRFGNCNMASSATSPEAAVPVDGRLPAANPVSSTRQLDFKIDGVRRNVDAIDIPETIQPVGKLVLKKIYADRKQNIDISRARHLVSVTSPMRPSRKFARIPPTTRDRLDCRSTLETTVPDVSRLKHPPAPSLGGTACRRARERPRRKQLHQHQHHHHHHQQQQHVMVAEDARLQLPPLLAAQTADNAESGRGINAADSAASFCTIDRSSIGGSSLDGCGLASHISAQSTHQASTLDHSGYYLNPDSRETDRLTEPTSRSAGTTRRPGRSRRKTQQQPQQQILVSSPIAGATSCPAPQIMTSGGFPVWLILCGNNNNNKVDCPPSYWRAVEQSPQNIVVERRGFQRNCLGMSAADSVVNANIPVGATNCVFVDQVRHDFPHDFVYLEKHIAGQTTSGSCSLNGRWRPSIQNACVNKPALQPLRQPLASDAGRVTLQSTEWRPQLLQSRQSTLSAPSAVVSQNFSPLWTQTVVPDSTVNAAVWPHTSSMLSSASAHSPVQRTSFGCGVLGVATSNPPRTRQPTSSTSDAVVSRSRYCGPAAATAIDRRTPMAEKSTLVPTPTNHRRGRQPKNNHSSVERACVNCGTTNTIREPDKHRFFRSLQLCCQRQPIRSRCSVVNTRPYLCPECPAVNGVSSVGAFSSAEELLAHLSLGHRSTVCSFCRARFANVANRRHHEATHHDVPLYDCDRCDRGFRTPLGLNRHEIRAHGDAVSGRHVNRYVRRNHREIPCNICNVRFRSRLQLERHQSTDHACRDRRTDGRPQRAAAAVAAARIAVAIAVGDGCYSDDDEDLEVVGTRRRRSETGS